MQIQHGAQQNSLLLLDSTSSCGVSHASCDSRYVIPFIKRSYLRWYDVGKRICPLFSVGVKSMFRNIAWWSYTHTEKELASHSVLHQYVSWGWCFNGNIPRLRKDLKMTGGMHARSNTSPNTAGNLALLIPLTHYDSLSVATDREV